MKKSRRTEAVYLKISFPNVKARPFFYTNFVQTVDGKVHVSDADRAYWPIGSQLDYATLVELRAHADVLIHGKNTALWVRTLDNLAKEDFQKRRKFLGKKKPLLYLVVSSNPDDELARSISKPPAGTASMLVTTRRAAVSKKLRDCAKIVRMGESKVDLVSLSSYLKKEKVNWALVEGGPILLGSFLAADLIDEVFVTIAPKIFGNSGSKTLTMAEDCLFPPDKVKKLFLLSAKPVKSEVYLRYRIIR